MDDIPAPAPPPPLRCPQHPLPPYRYIPGIHPHPFRHADGHFHQNPPLSPVSDWMSWSSHEAWLRGLDLFDQRYYWECHEQLEGIWLQIPKDNPLNGFVQSLIQAAAFRLKWHMGHRPSAIQLLEGAKKRLTLARDELQQQVWSVDIPHLLSELDQAISKDHWPVLRSH